MELVNYSQWLEGSNLSSKSEEVQTQAFIKHLSFCASARVLLEDFPQSEFQAKYFVKNAVTPAHVFRLDCSKDIC